jgi:archaellum biogenesis ATPase FlaH
MSIIERIWARLPGEYFFLSTKTKAGAWKDYPIKRSDFHKIDDFIEEHSDKNQYWCPHGFSHPKRLEKYAVLPRALWADLDDVDPRKLNGTKPSLAWESSPGRFAGVWLINKPMNKLLNKRLTYTLGADKGGWDLTQVLRIPGTTNYKYGKGVPGKKLWFKPTPIDVDDLESHLRDDIDSDGKPGVVGSDASAIFKKYSPMLKIKYRQMLVLKKAVGDRSKGLWELGFALIEAGLNREEWLTLIGSSVWNKFVDRPHQLEREYDKILALKLPGASKHKPVVDDDRDEGEAASFEAGLQWASDIEEQDISWALPGWLPRRMITIIEGDPGIGKSWIAQFMALCVAGGKKFPTHNQYGIDTRAEKGGVLYVDLENDLQSVTKKRLRWMGMTDDQARLIAIYDKGMDLNDEDQLNELRSFLQSVKGTARQIRVLFVDTVAAYLGEIDAHNSKDVAQFMGRLAELAREFDMAVVLLRHLAKASAGRSAIMAGMGSMSFSGMARMIHRVAEHPTEAGVNIIKPIKSGISRKEPALKFELIEGKRVGLEIPTLVSIAGFDTEVTDEQLGAMDKKKNKEDPLTEAKIWLAAQLAEIGCYVKGLKDEIERRNKPFKWSHVEKAATELGVNKRQRSGHSYWELKQPKK